MKQGDCILVGNGTSIMDRECGSIIDQFDCIVRFNLFEIRGYEKHVGTKTDVWFCGMGIKPDNWRASMEYRQIILHSWHKEVCRCPVVESFRRTMPEASIEKVDHAEMDAMKEFSGHDYWHWSTGAIAVWLMSRKFPVVHLTGFDWWDRIEQHYFMPKANRGMLHKPEIEKALFDRMKSEGRIEFL